MTDRFVLDAALSRFTVQAFAGGMLSALAHNPRFAIRGFPGELQFTPESIAPAMLSVP